MVADLSSSWPHQTPTPATAFGLPLFLQAPSEKTRSSPEASFASVDAKALKGVLACVLALGVGFTDAATATLLGAADELDATALDEGLGIGGATPSFSHFSASARVGYFLYLFPLNPEIDASHSSLLVRLALEDS